MYKWTREGSRPTSIGRHARRAEGRCSMLSLFKLRGLNFAGRISYQSLLQRRTCDWNTSKSIGCLPILLSRKYLCGKV